MTASKPLLHPNVSHDSDCGCEYKGITPTYRAFFQSSGNIVLIYHDLKNLIDRTQRSFATQGSTVAGSHLRMKASLA